MSEHKVIFELDENESKWWKETLKKERSEYIKKPREYVRNFLSMAPIDIDATKRDATKEIFRIRNACWNEYMKDEVNFHTNVVRKLVEEREIPRTVLNQVAESRASYTTDDINSTELAGIVGEFSGKIMPYLYALSLSTTNSRRSRAGQTFEEIIDSILTARNFPYDSQGKLGTKFYKDNDLGKLVDGIIPSASAYIKDRSHCDILTMKTTLRERWQEVVEEITRTNIPSAYLLTLDQNLTENSLKTMANHNITVVACDQVCENLSDMKNIMSFTFLFNKAIPHTLAYWDL